MSDALPFRPTPYLRYKKKKKQDIPKDYPAVEKEFIVQQKWIQEEKQIIQLSNNKTQIKMIVTAEEWRDLEVVE